MYLVNTDHFCHVCFSIVCFCGRYLVWNNMETYAIWFQFWFSDVPDFDEDNEVDDYHDDYYTDSDNEAVLWAAPRCCNPSGCWISETQTNFKGWDSSPAVLQRLVARGPVGRPDTCPCYMYITLTLTCNLRAVAAWRPGLCVCVQK